MPIYEFKCQNCGQTFEIFQKTLAEKPPCPHCGSPDLKKLLSSPATVSLKNHSPQGTTCCGRTERCDTPPCTSEGTGRRDK